MKKRLLPIVILGLYAILLIKVMVFKDLPVFRIGHFMLSLGGTDAGGAPNFVPFKTISLYLFDAGWLIASINLIGNIALLVPVGFLLPFVYPNVLWKTALAIAVGSGLAIETLQVVLRVGIFDIDDVILNGLGVMIGYFAIRGFKKLKSASI